MHNELSARMLICSSVFSCLSAIAMTASSALLIVCRFGCNLIYMCVIESDLGLTTPAPNVGLPLTCEPSV